MTKTKQTELKASILKNLKSGNSSSPCEAMTKEKVEVTEMDGRKWMQTFDDRRFDSEHKKKRLQMCWSL